VSIRWLIFADHSEDSAFAKVAENMERNIELKPKASAGAHAEAMRRISQALAMRKDGHPERALHELSQVTLAAPSLAEGHHQLGNVLKSLGRFREAVDSLGKAALLAPNNAAVLFNLGVALLEIKAYPEAANCLRVAVKLEPGRFGLSRTTRLLSITWDAPYRRKDAQRRPFRITVTRSRSLQAPRYTATCCIR
jgi:tetratricopeptide (TPR) repeat protein